MVYDMIGKQACMGDHKVHSYKHTNCAQLTFFLLFYLKAKYYGTRIRMFLKQKSSLFKKQFKSKS